MVARTAFTQLRYSWLLLMICTLLMVACFVAPVAALFAPEAHARGVALAAWLTMWLVYLPTVPYRAETVGCSANARPGEAAAMTPGT